MSESMHPNLAKILAAMPGTCEDFAKRTGLNIRTVRGWIKLKRDVQPRIFHISGWRHVQKSSKPAAVYSRGDRADKPFIPLTPAERWERYYKQPGIREKRIADHVSYYKRKKALKYASNPFAQLFAHIDHRRTLK